MFEDLISGSTTPVAPPKPDHGDLTHTIHGHRTPNSKVIDVVFRGITFQCDADDREGAIRTLELVLRDILMNCVEVDYIVSHHPVDIVIT